MQRISRNLTKPIRKKQDFYDNAGSCSKNDDLHHTIHPLLSVILIILQALAAGGLVGLIIFLFTEGF